MGFFEFEGLLGPLDGDIGSIESRITLLSDFLNTMNGAYHGSG